MAQTQAFQKAVQTLTDRDRSDLHGGRCVIVESQNRHQGFILIDTDRATVWEVITDYENFPSFLPTVVETRVVADEGDRKLVEQVDERNVLFTTVTSRIQTENVETPPHQITFRMTEGDLNHFQGRWQAIAATESERPTLLLQTVEAEAGVGPLEMAFDQILLRSLKANLESISRETSRRYRLAAQ
ncbi:MAG: SRPBCC family protein [Elainellaceae cyanobacterium]